jgi:hypothetical protein
MSTVGGGVNIVTNGLVLYLDASNTKSYVSGSTIWNDVSRSGNNGTLTNGPTFNSGNGGSIVFDGTNDYVLIDSNFSLNTSIGFTINLWFKLTSYSSQFPTLFTLKTNSASGLALLLTTEAAYSPLTFGWNGISYKPSTTILIGIWNSISIIYNGSGISTISNFIFYINGTPVNLSPSGAFEGISQINTLGTLNSGTVNFQLNGNIAQTSIYNRALSASEVLQNFNATKSRFGL